MAKEALYTIRNIDCQYHSNKYPVLKLSNLDIGKGEVYFIVGSSGVGKSTILETLGLMNNTMRTKEGSKMTFNPGANESEVEMTELWGKGESALAKFRKKNLSFIFQNTNLFGNLSAYQNASISQILQGKTKAEANLKARQLLSRLYDKDFVKQIILGKKTQEMSGGQRQRLAFARALGTDYKILLADEPTGNLDYHNAQKLVQILTGIIKSEHRTAVIVSHDIDLAVKYADKIVLISKETMDTPDGPNVYGVVNDESVFNRGENDQWNNNGGIAPKTSDAMNAFLKEAIKETPN